MASRKNRRAAKTAGDQRGFTLLELMATAALIILLSAVALPLYNGAVLKARVARATGDITGIDTDLERSRGNNNGQLPATLAEIGKDTLRDPWGNPYQYLNIEVGVNRGSVRKDRNLVPLNTDYDLYSMGEDGLSKKPLTAKASRDDILRAGNGGFIGPAKDF